MALQHTIQGNGRFLFRGCIGGIGFSQEVCITEIDKAMRSMVKKGFISIILKMPKMTSFKICSVQVTINCDIGLFMDSQVRRNYAN